MAGDWIKMRGNLWDDPRVARLVDMTDSSEAAVIGGLYWLWATADQHTESGFLPGLTLRQIDRKTAIPGFGAALVAVGWLIDSPDGVTITNFAEHNGASAKRRSEDAKRKANVRKDSDKTRTDDGIPADVLGRIAELEKELEKEKSKRKRKTGDGDASPTGSRLPADWQLPDDWAEWAQQTRPDLNPQTTAERFADYWHGAAGAKGRKADWLATWRNWVRDQKPTVRAVSGPASFAERDEQARRRKWEEMTGRKWPTDGAPIDLANVIDVAATRTLEIAL